jgi:HK97 gp10 family phage protein
MTSGIQVKGLDKLQKALKDNVTLDDVKRVVRQNGSELQTKMQQNADFTQGYQTGTTKRSIGLEIKDSGFTAEVAPTTEYAPYLEYGTRFMSAQPFVKPAYEQQKEQFKKDMDRLVK